VQALAHSKRLSGRRCPPPGADEVVEPPRVEVCVIATSGRFTTDAVGLIESHNQSDTSLRIEMWPESHLERLLASRPWIIAEFDLR